MPNKNRTPNRFKTYNDLLVKSLLRGIEYTKTMDEFINTHDPKKLLSSAKHLVKYHLNTKYLKFPIQYRTADYYLLFMTRLFALHGMGGQLLLLPIKKGSLNLEQEISSLGDADQFVFYVSSQGQVYYRDRKYKKALFTLDFERNRFAFATRALVQLFIMDYKKIKSRNVDKIIQMLVDFGRFLKKDYQFHVDFSILSSSNQKFYLFNPNSDHKAMIDKLFVLAFQNHYMVTSYRDGAQLKLNSALKLRIFSKNHRWGFQILDSNNQVSWLDLILRFDFLKRWYLDNIKQFLVK